MFAHRRVLHVLGRMQPGGVEMRLLESMGDSARHDFRVDVCALSGWRDRWTIAFSALGGTVTPLRLKSFDSPPDS